MAWKPAVIHRPPDLTTMYNITRQWTRVQPNLWRQSTRHVNWYIRIMYLERGFERQMWDYSEIINQCEWPFTGKWK